MLENLPYQYIVKSKNLARTSGKPETQLLNFSTLMTSSRFIVDVPGYGYAKVSKTERVKWGKMIEEYLTSRKILEQLSSSGLSP